MIRAVTALASQVADSPSTRRVAPGTSLGLLDELRALAGHAHLVAVLVRRELVVRYKRSSLGIFWTLLHPLLMMLIFFTVFSHAFRAEIPNYALYFLSQYLAWLFFSQAVTSTMNNVQWNGNIMRRVPVPRTIFALTTTLSGLVHLLVALALYFLIAIAQGYQFSPALAFLPVSLLILSVFTLGVALLGNAISIFFVDAREMVRAGLPALLFLTPVIYPRSIVPPQFEWILKVNPLIYILQIVRDPIYYGIVPARLTLVIAATLAVASLTIGWIVFRHLAPKFYPHL
jgi:ABC-2 type transport system permease protein